MVSFGTAGIRGSFDELTPELAYKIGNVFARQTERDMIFVATDVRKTRDALSFALMSGALSAGKNVFHLGPLPTPAAELYFHDKRESIMPPTVIGPWMTLDPATQYQIGGILFVVTASHNPPQDNGIKIFKEGGLEYTKEEANNLLNNSEVELVKWERVGRVIFRDKEAKGNYMQFLYNMVGVLEPSFIFDLAGGAATVLDIDKIVPKASLINSQLDPYFSSRPSEPREENLRELIEKSKRSGKLGLALDGDADRCSLVHPKEGFLGGDYAFAIALAELYERGYKGDVCTTVATTKLIDDVAAHYGYKVKRSKVGSPYIVECMAENGIKLGGENVGGIIVGERSFAKDGILAALLVMSYEERKGVDSFLDEFPRYYSVQGKAQIGQNLDLTAAFERVEGHYGGEVLREDGLRIDLGDEWFIIRQSGTEPSLLRIIVEGRDKAKVERLYEELKGFFS